MVDNGEATTRYLEAIFRNRFLVLLITGAIFFGSVAYALFAKKQYSSTMRILVQNTRATPVVSADATIAQVSGGAGIDAMEAQINSEALMLQSNDLLEGLVRYRDQSLLHRPVPDEGSQQMAWQVAEMQHRLEVTAVRKTNLIEVSLRDPDAMAAQRSLQWLSTSFLDKHAELRRSAGTYRFFDTKAKQYDQQLQNAESELVAFQRANDLVSLDQEKSLTRDNYNRVMQQVGDTRTRLADSSMRLSSLRDQLALESGRITTQIHESPNQYSADRLATLLVDLQNKKTQLAVRFQPSDPLVKEIDEQIDFTQMTLNKLKTQNQVETTSDNNPVHLVLDQSLRTTTVERNGADARMAALVTLARTYANRLNELQQLSVDSDRLERNVQEAKQNRDVYAQKRDQAAIDDELDRSKIVDVSIAQEPTVSWNAVRPQRFLTVALGGLAACFIALGCVLIKDTMRTTAFTPAELEAMIPLPVLATIPYNPESVQLPTTAPGLPVAVKVRPFEPVLDHKQVQPA